MTITLVLTTVATPEQARALADALVGRRLVACAQISAVESVYRWQGAVQHEPEQRLLLKTTRERYPAVEAALRELHPYELPAIVAVDGAQAFAPFADWVAKQTGGG